MRFLLLFAVSCLLLLRFLLIFSNSVDLDGTEFTFVIFSKLLLQGHQLYTDPMEFPFLSVLYNPGYPYLLSFLCKVFGFNAQTETHHVFVLARSLSFASMIVNIFFILKIFNRLKLPSVYSLASLVFYLLLITGHFYVTRPDGIKSTLFTIMLFYTLEFFFFKGKIKNLFLAGGAGLLAVCLKQDALVPIYLLLTLLCFRRRSKASYRLFIFFTIGAGALYLLMYSLFGKYFFANTFLFNLQLNEHINYSINLLIVLFSVIRFLPLILLLVQKPDTNHSGEKSLLSFLCYLAATSLLVSHISMLRPGAYLNYTYEAVLLTVTAASFFLYTNQGFLHQHLRKIAAGGALYAAFLITGNWFIHSYSYHPEKEVEYRQLQTDIIHETSAISVLIKNEVTFITDTKNILYFTEKNLIFGYNFHLDRYLSYYIGERFKQSETVSMKDALIQKMGAQLLFCSSDYYDAFFTNGKVKYIIAYNNEMEATKIAAYYPGYVLYRPFNHFAVYQFHQPQIQ